VLRDIREELYHTLQVREQADTGSGLVAPWRSARVSDSASLRALQRFPSTYATLAFVLCNYPLQLLVFVRSLPQGLLSLVTLLATMPGYIRIGVLHLLFGHVANVALFKNARDSVSFWSVSF
jgi:hypothetical protein